MKFILLLSLPLYALDQITKWLVLRHVHPEELRVVIPDFFSLVNVTNDGAAFGSFKNNNTFFIVLSCVAFVFVLALLLRRRSPDALRDISLALLLAGIMGNLTDRFLHGHVIDFLLFDLHIPFAIFTRGPPLTSPTPASASRSFASSFTLSRSRAGRRRLRLSSAANRPELVSLILSLKSGGPQPAFPADRKTGFRESDKPREAGRLRSSSFRRRR